MILITGASGRVAHRAAELLADGEQELRLMSRTPNRVTGFTHAQIVYGDFAEPATLDAAFAGIAVALVVSGGAKPGLRAERHRGVFEAAARARVQHVVYLSLQGASPKSKFPFSRDHFDSEQYLAETGVPFTILRNSFYIDMFLGMFDEAGVIRGPAEQGQAAFVSREDCARAAAAVLKAPPGGIHEITGPEALSLEDVVTRLSALTGRSLQYENEPVEAGRERRIRSGELASQADLWLGWSQAIAAGELERTSDAVLRFTGKPPLTVDGYFQAFPQLLDPLRLQGGRV
jgi:uncharacterized protein YbjT (DUF2867 family)